MALYIRPIIGKWIHLALIKSISGIRGTIGGKIDENLTPLDIVKYSSAYAHWLKSGGGKLVVLGRDARISGDLVLNLVANSIMSYGIDVIDIGLTTTPTVAMAVLKQQADGGIVVTASHNPMHWNAMKFLDKNGCFLDHEAANEIISLNEEVLIYAQIEDLGKREFYAKAIEDHIDEILNLPFVHVEDLRSKKFKVLVDCINSTGAISIIPLLNKLGCRVIALNDEMHGDFQHPAEPLPKHLSQLSDRVVAHKADLGIAVDPDVDRICFVCEDGSFFGEENTIVAAADYLLNLSPGPVVSNLSSSQALRDLANDYNVPYHASAVGELNVVLKMKEVEAVIGGEGNGGVILPDLHYGRDGLVGAVMILCLLMERGKKLSDIKESYPSYQMIKEKVELPDRSAIARVFKALKEQEAMEKDWQDGLKLYFGDSWVHLRASNTEPILRIYTEAKSKEKAQQLAFQYKDLIKGLL